MTRIILKGKQKFSSLPKPVQTKVANILECLKDLPLIDILKIIDYEKANKILSLIDKITALAHLSQSMGNYFARDDSLDPALSIVCEALRGNIDFELLLRSRGGTFQTLASAYYHLKSPVDHDLSGNTQTSKTKKYRGGRNFRDPPRQTATSKRHCWYFQKHGRCSKPDCSYSHRCLRCGSKNHGEKTCRSDKGKRQVSAQFKSKLENLKISFPYRFINVSSLVVCNSFVVVFIFILVFSTRIDNC